MFNKFTMLKFDLTLSIVPILVNIGSTTIRVEYPVGTWQPIWAKITISYTCLSNVLFSLLMGEIFIKSMQYVAKSMQYFKRRSSFYPGITLSKEKLRFAEMKVKPNLHMSNFQIFKFKTCVSSSYMSEMNSNYWTT